jgi:hypothetical protein
MFQARGTWRNGPCALAALLFSWPALAANLDLRQAAIVIPLNASVAQRKSASMLAEEIEKRTQLRLKIQTQRPQGAAFVLERGTQPGAAESFSLTASGPVVTVSGHDDRGVLFGTGYLLRQLRMGRQRLELPSGLDIATAPKVPIRGHQLGYRPKTNAYDAWSVPMWEQYIRELAIFGTNTVELIPPRSDDDADSPHFPLPPMEMMVEMSRICNEYGLDVSIWYPAMDKDYSNPATVEFALKEWAEVFERLPRIDAVFVPGGDPGHTQPKYLMAMLEKQSVSLHKFHPKAQMWVAPQGFNKEWMEEFLGILKSEPRWLSGVVFGPQSRLPLPELRERTPKRYPIRLYPDITHSFASQYPVPDWDAAFSLTEGREGINPRPLGEAAIFRSSVPYSIGFVSYSEGCNDDVNKFVWSGLGWNPDADVKSILTEYSRFFIGDQVAAGFGEGLLALERNWKGPLLSNAGVDTALLQFQEMERNATPQMRGNWRFQEAMYRAHYDAFLRSRLIAETAQEEKALSELQRARRAGSLTSLTTAESILDADMRTERTRELRARVFELAEGLFNSIRMQLSVPRYRAIGLRRGANLDGIDFGLNNRAWLKERFAEIRAMNTESDRLARIDTILNWTNPGPGGFYDDLGNPAQQPHLVRGEGFEKDPEFRNSAMMGIGSRSPDQGWRVSWYTDAESLFDAPLRMKYTGLDSTARYRVRVVYAGDTRVPIRMVANGSVEIHPFRDKPNPVVPLDFDIPGETTRSGTLVLEWTRTPGLGGAGRGAQVAEVWLMRVGATQ